MYKLWAAILKDYRILIRDVAGWVIMFGMPVLLVVVITIIQNSTFKMVNNNKVPLILCNRDGGESSIQLVEALQKIGMFDLQKADSSLSDEQLTTLMHKKDALIALAIPKGFSQAIVSKAQNVSAKALSNLGMSLKGKAVVGEQKVALIPVTMFYNPVLQESFRYSVKGALHSAQQFTENRQVLQAIYQSLNNQKLPADLEKEILSNQTPINEVPTAKDGSKIIPNATQHNVPAWTIFAMFFTVVTLSTNIVKEKLSGSFLRLKTLPSNYLISLLAKQVTFIGVTMAQVLVIFSLGIFLFPHIGLPRLNLPVDIAGLLLVSLICGWCAVSYGVVVGVYAKTMEQAIGFGSASVVILAAIGGIVVPSFAMPEALRLLMKISPLYWCLQSYYGMFLEGGHIKDVLHSIFPILLIIAALQVTAFAGLKRQHLI